MPSNYVLLTIQSEHAERIYSGDKKAELRKSFAAQANIVFLYETAPASAITGAFIVDEAIKTTVHNAINIAENYGVARERSTEYYQGRDSGWVIKISCAIKFSQPIPLRDLRGRDHYFSVPQTFCYLNKYEGLTQDLLCVFRSQLDQSLMLRPLSLSNRQLISDLIRSEIGQNYEDIDEDFVHQVLNPEVGAKSAFSTLSKQVMELVWKEQLIGFTVLSVKEHGAWKSGPSILLPHYRGFGFGQEMRRVIERYCLEEGARALYCTCSESQPLVVSYLLNSGMQLQARLKGHLSRDRDELVFAKKLTEWKHETLPSTKGLAEPKTVRCARIFSTDERAPKVISHFVKHMIKWYFRPNPGLSKAILESLRTFETGPQSYSLKSRAIYGCFDSNDKVCAVALLTPKRSDMVKVNLVSTIKDQSVLEKLLNRLLRDFAHYRRIYITVPTREFGAIEALSTHNFRLEGILQDPFCSGLDHACFGRITS